MSLGRKREKVKNFSDNGASPDVLDQSPLSAKRSSSFTLHCMIQIKTIVSLLSHNPNFFLGTRGFMTRIAAARASASFVISFSAERMACSH